MSRSTHIRLLLLGATLGLHCLQSTVTRAATDKRSRGSVMAKGGEVLWIGFEAECVMCVRGKEKRFM